MQLAFTKFRDRKWKREGSFLCGCHIINLKGNLLFLDPRNPKEPQNLTLSDARLVDGKLRITLRWSKPASDVPITFYKVFWSRLVHGPTNDSILVYHRTVLKVSFT